MRKMRICLIINLSRTEGDDSINDRWPCRNQSCLFTARWSRQSFYSMTLIFCWGNHDKALEFFNTYSILMCWIITFLTFHSPEQYNCINIEVDLPTQLRNWSYECILWVVSTKVGWIDDTLGTYGDTAYSIWHFRKNDVQNVQLTCKHLSYNWQEMGTTMPMMTTFKLTDTMLLTRTVEHTCLQSALSSIMNFEWIYESFSFAVDKILWRSWSGIDSTSAFDTNIV